MTNFTAHGPWRLHRGVAILITASTLLPLPSTASAFAVDGVTRWVAPAGASASWHDAINWDNGVPNASTVATIQRFGVVEHSQASGVADGLSLQSTSGNAALRLTSGTLSVLGNTFVGETQGTNGINQVGPSSVLELAGAVYLGQDGRGSISQTGGEVRIDHQYHIFLGNGTASSSYGQYTMTGGALTAGLVVVGSLNNGLFIQSGGMVDISNTLVVGNEGIGAGNYVVTGSASLETNTLQIGRFKGGTMAQSGGSVHADTAVLGESSGAIGIYTLNGGQLTGSIQRIGSRGESSFSQSGGTNRARTMTLGQEVGGVGAYHLSGGTLTIESQLAVGERGMGSLRIIGADASIAIRDYSQNALSTLHSELNVDGISPIVASGHAALLGNWIVTTAGAPIGRYDVVRASQGIVGTFDSVTLPVGKWEWGITATTLWVAHIPEPASLVVAAAGLTLIATLRYRHQRVAMYD